MKKQTVLKTLFCLGLLAAGAGILGGAAFGAKAETGPKTLKISSPDFKNNEALPKRFTCEGKNINPTIRIESVPDQTKSLILIVDDPDAPSGLWTHWILYDIPVLTQIDPGGIPGKQALNNFGRVGYGGPCPPSGTHRYFFKIFAMDEYLNLPEGLSRREIEDAMQGHVIARAELVGLFKRSGSK